MILNRGFHGFQGWGKNGIIQPQGSKLSYCSTEVLLSDGRRKEE